MHGSHTCHGLTPNNAFERPEYDWGRRLAAAEALWLAAQLSGRAGNRAPMTKDVSAHK